jgi:hypothetical protein
VIICQFVNGDQFVSLVILSMGNSMNQIVNSVIVDGRGPHCTASQWRGIEGSVSTLDPLIKTYKLLNLSHYPVVEIKVVFHRLEIAAAYP